MFSYLNILVWSIVYLFFYASSMSNSKPNSKPNSKQLTLINTLLLLSKRTKNLDALLLHDLDISINGLYVLYAADNCSVISLKDLKSSLHIQPVSLSRILGNLYDNKLIQRSFSGEDKRSINITLTEKGKTMVQYSKNLVKKVLNESNLDLDMTLESLHSVTSFVTGLWNIYKKKYPLTTWFESTH